MSKDIQVYVISHSAEDIKNIKSNEIYTPLFVGRNGQDNLGFVSDDTGENISSKNSSYCELTGLYWMWKNSPADIIGLVHYRRYFANWRFGHRLEKEDLEKIFDTSGNIQETEEFMSAGIEVKTVRIKQNGMPKEDMSFPAFKYMEIR